MPPVSQLIQPLQDDDQLFFIHIPKTAGTTFNDILHTRYLEKDICPIAWPYSDLLDIKDELPGYKLIRGHFPYYLVNHLPKMPVCVTFLREPIARTLSFFDQAQRRSDFPSYDRIKDLSFEEFLQTEKLLKQFSNTQTIYFCKDTTQQSGDLDLQLARRNLASLPFIGITEEFDRSMELFTYTFGLTSIPQFQNKNISPRRKKRADVMENYQDVLEKYNREDLDLYEFGRQLFEQRYQTMQDEKRAGAVPASPLPRRDSIYTTLTQVDPGAGWYRGTYNDQKGPIRWTGPASVASLTLKPLKAGRQYVIRFRVIRQIVQHAVETLSLTANGISISLTRHEEAYNNYQFEGVLPLAVSDNPTNTRLEFHIPATTSPAEVEASSTDTRQLGIQIQWVHIYPR